SPDQVRHRHRPVLGRCQVRRGHDDVADVAPGQLEPAGEEVEVDVVGAGKLRPQVALPEAVAVLLFRHGEVDNGVEAAGEGLVDVGTEGGRQDRRAVEEINAV